MSSPDHNACPSPEILLDFDAGRLDDERLETIAEHVANCSSCDQTLAEQSNSTVIRRLRNAPIQEYYCDESECRAGLELAQALSVQFQGESTPSFGEVALPERFGSYRIVEKIGQGAMGAVFRAQHTRLSKTFALKVLPNELMAKPEAVVRFEREMKAVGKLEHPNLVRASDAGEIAGIRFLAMEFVDGINLSEMVQENGPLPFDQACSIIRQAATGLHYVHQQGFIHRDVKPSNLMLTPAGTVKVLDLGLARLAPQPSDATDASVTSNEAIMGTIDYMSPEQALDVKKVDARADVYSLGCTLYYLLTGNPVFGQGTPMQRLVAHRETDIPSLSTRCPNAPMALESLFRRMVAKKPSERFADMSEVIVALDAAHAPQKNLRFNWRLASMVATIAILMGSAIYFRPQPVKSPREFSAPTVSQLDSTTTTTNQDDAPFDDRSAALWTLRSRGKIRIRLGDEERTVNSPTELPAADFRLVEIELLNIPVSDDDVRRLNALTDLEMVDFDGSNVGDKGLRSIASLPSIRNISLSNTQVTGSGLRSLDGVDLYGFSLGQSDISDDDLAVVHTMPNLRWLYLGDTQLTDNGLRHLHGLKQLSNINIQGTLVSESGISALHNALPDCRIESDFGILEPNTN